MPRDIPTAAVRALEHTLRQRLAGDVDFGTAARALYATDASNYRQVPIGVVRPRTTEDVVEIVRLCSVYGVRLLPRGAGTSLAGQCCNVALVMDMSRHLGSVLAIDPERKTARVQPGVVLDNLQRAARPFGLMYGPDPSTHAWCTLGGMIGNNSCGVHSVAAGLTADVVEELDVLTTDGLRLRVGATAPDDLDRIAREPGRRGDVYKRLRALRDQHADEIRTRYPRIPRRVSGYELDALLPEHDFNVARALVGSEGTCVTVLEATVRLMEVPRARALLVLGFSDIFTAADEVMKVLEARPIGLEALDDVLVGNLRRKAKLPQEIRLLPDGKAWLLVEFGADTANSAEATARELLTKLLRGWSAPSATVFTDPHDIEMIWRVRESGLGATAFVPGEAATWEGWEDAAVAPERLGAYLRDFRRLLDRFRFRGALYGHFGQGCVHTRTNFDLQTPAGIATYRAFIGEAADLVVSYGGSLSGEHGDGQARAELLPKMFGDTLVGAFREFKHIWDPDGLMNPGKVVDPYAATDHLRRPGYQPAPVRTFFTLAAEGGIAGAALRCVGVGKCRKTDEGTMCPSYMATGEEQHSTRGRAHLLFEMLRGETITSGWESEEVKHALDLCLACKACKSECPVSVDMATYKAEFLAHFYARRTHPLRDHLFGHIDWWAMVAARAPRLVNALSSFGPIARPLQAAAGIASARRLPQFARQTFQRWMARHPPRSEGRPVVLWSDTFTNYFAPQVGRAAVHVLEHLGYHVTVPPQTCCGRPLYDFGLLESAREHLDAMFERLADERYRAAPIVVLEPSCFAVFQDEARNLAPDRPAAREVAERTVLFEAFVQTHFEHGDLPALIGDALVHVHCHQQAIAGRDRIAATLAAAQPKARLLDAGCCGMAGSFGLDAQHYDVSMSIGERVLFPEVRHASPTCAIVANGFSCREQIRHGTTRQAYHLAELVSQAIASGATGDGPRAHT
jgi:FAD/FMN-containing dehydrogenase/Fe-S oxidoreductase